LDVHPKKCFDNRVVRGLAVLVGLDVSIDLILFEELQPVVKVRLSCAVSFPEEFQVYENDACDESHPDRAFALGWLTGPNELPDCFAVLSQHKLLLNV
jgi:hypothetical protein